jgi:hypothetical protein
LHAGISAAFIDLDQIGFCSPAPAGDTGHHRVKARNLAALWQTYRAAGAQRLIVVGPVEDEAALRTYAGALPSATLTRGDRRPDRQPDRMARAGRISGRGTAAGSSGTPTADRGAALRQPTRERRT